jgi:pimeloyl-ACP methyl ester carboxylesterase
MPKKAKPNPDTIVLIHGLFVESRSWEGWAERYTGKGYNVLSPSWPGLEGGVEELRRDSTPLTKLDVTTIVDHYDRIIRGLDSPPIVMGHSLGGTITQLLLDRGLGAAAVGVEAATVKGVLDLPLSTLKANRAVLGNPFNKGKATMLDEEQFRYGFTNTFSDEAAKAAYDRYAIPCANRVLFQVAFQNLPWTNATRVDFGKDDRAPLLFIAGGEDHIVPPNVNRSNVKKYARSRAVTEYKLYPGRSHFTMVQEGWEEVADFALDWAVEHVKPRAEAPAAASVADMPVETS